jgi:hypothetical protein
MVAEQSVTGANVETGGETLPAAAATAGGSGGGCAGLADAGPADAGTGVDVVGVLASEDGVAVEVAVVFGGVPFEGVDDLT